MTTAPMTNHTPPATLPDTHPLGSTPPSSTAPTGNQTNYNAPTHSADYRKLAELIKDVRVAMLVTFFPATSSSDTPLPHIRPMYTQGVDPDRFVGDLWFMSDASSSKIGEIGREHRVALTYAAPDKNRYIVVNGWATCERNPEKARELWNIHAKGWWPGGPDDPNLLMVRVRVESAEYWDGPSNTGYMISLLKAVVTSRPIELKTDHGKVG